MKFSDQRKIMIQQQLISRGIISEPVLTAFLKVPRESFVSENMQYLAYSDTPLA
ncbi:MAG: protein-L-isoaspartate O-methyltransferase, partial [Candidatus Cloacimonetes bacterium]|nr:protein-L-isoaspartate O-methyltransferase [Candidatus Cloacimonadota bacterium]